MVRAWPLAGYVVLKFGRIFPKVVEQSDDGAQARRSKFFRPQRGELRYGFKMHCQRLPCILILISNRMSEEHVRLRTSRAVQRSVKISDMPEVLPSDDDSENLNRFS